MHGSLELLIGPVFQEDVFMCDLDQHKVKGTFVTD